MTLLGIDISSHQPSIDWAKVAAAGVGFAFVKCAGDEGYVNPYYHQQLDGARAHGILVGSYYYDQPGWADYAARADHFLGHLDWREGEPIALDVEEGEGDLTAVTLDWLAYVEGRTGLLPLVYTYPWFAQQHIGRDPRLARYPLWFADYNPTPRAAPPPWTRVAIRQYTADGRIDGIAGTVVDLNTFDGTRDDFRALGTGGPARRELDPNRLRAWFANHRRIA